MGTGKRIYYVKDNIGTMCINALHIASNKNN